MENNEAGERALIAGIINNAIIDGISVKRPRPPEYRNKKKDAKVIAKQKAYMIACMNLLMKALKKSQRHKLPTFIIYLFSLLEVSKIGEKEYIGWEGRRFINPKNVMFKFYVELLGYDPVFLSKKIHEFFYKVDHGLITQKMVKEKNGSLEINPI